MNDNVGLYMIHNSRIVVSNAEVAIDTSAGKTAYEVIRIINGVPLFYEDHYNRMKETLKTIGTDLKMTKEQMADIIKTLLKANKLYVCNIMVIVSEAGKDQNHIIYIKKHSYPTNEEADAGVKTGLFEIERKNPNAKIINQSYKDAVAKKINDGGFYEVLLVDSQGRITEGSRSNAFFVINGAIWTAPGEAVLKGVTRKYVFEACRRTGCEVVERFVDAGSISRAEGAFLSGTSIKVLPIATVDNIALDSPKSPVVAAIRREYDMLLEKYIDENVKYW
jgi:branched-chain amino acid aminotransferase